MKNIFSANTSICSEVLNKIILMGDSFFNQTGIKIETRRLNSCILTATLERLISKENIPGGRPHSYDSEKIKIVFEHFDFSKRTDLAYAGASLSDYLMRKLDAVQCGLRFDHCVKFKNKIPKIEKVRQAVYNVGINHFDISVDEVLKIYNNPVEE